MTAADLCYTPATELARLVRARELSPVEIVRTILERIERLEPGLNAFAVRTPERALEAARAAERAVTSGQPLGPLHGVPYTIKDLAPVAGLPYRAGSAIFAGRVAEADAPVARRLAAAGGILLGKTTTPEFGWKAIGDSPLTGITRNPWQRAHTTGGSSAGAGAAAAAGFGPLAHGSDGAGSIRIPAAFCGLVGLKPSFGRVPSWPASNNDYVSHQGPMTRTVADAALMLAVLAGPDDMDRLSLEAAPEDYCGELHRGIAGLRVAWSPTLGGHRVEPEVARIVADAVQALAEAGGRVEAVEPDWPDSRDLIRKLWSAHEAGMYGKYLPEWRDRMDPGLVACIETGREIGLAEYCELRERKLAWWDPVRTFFETWDLLVTPTVSVPALPVGRINPPGWPDHAWDWLGWASFSYPFNFTWQPAITVPAGWTSEGLPVGLQIVGRRFADLTVLQAAAAFEAVRPWAGRRPPVDVSEP